MRKRVLVLDDEPILARSVARVLSVKYDVDIFLRAEDALKALTERRYDCVVSDVQMAEMSGPQFYSQVTRKHPRLRRRFLFFTGTPDEIQLDVPFLVKPSGMIKIQDMVEQLIK